MVALKVEAFGGMLPAVDPNLLPNTAAALSQNAWVYAGTIAGMNAPTLLRTLAATTNKVYRVPTSYNDSLHLNVATWMEFQNIDTDVLRSPVIGETFDRYYWTSPVQQSQYNTLARIKAGNTGANAPFLLGIPTPPNAPGVSTAGGSSSTNRTTAYAYTWVSAYGEEGPPSPPTTLTGKIDSTWNITLTAPSAGDLGINRNITKVRIYRTVTSAQGVATFFLVVEQPVATLIYADIKTDTLVSQSTSLLSTNWSAPPTDLAGFVAMPNGIFAGFRANEIWFCEPYRPHAWPPQYTLAVDYPIVGLGVVGQTVVVCTQSYPYAISGIHPSVMTQSRLAALEPCMSRGSVLSAPEGVYYVSPNGLVQVANGTVQNVTKNLATKDKWQQFISPTVLATSRAARLGGAYYMWGSVRQGVFETTAFDTSSFAQADFTGALNGVLIDPASQRVAFNVLTNSTPLQNVQNDPWSGEVFVIRNSNLYWLDISNQTPTHEIYKWRSRIWQLNKPDNLEAVRVYFDTPSTAPALNPTPNASLVQTLQANQWGLLRIYADGILIWTRELRSSGEMMRLPSQTKYEYLQFEFESLLTIKSVQFATSAKELATV